MILIGNANIFFNHFESRKNDIFSFWAGFTFLGFVIVPTQSWYQMQVIILLFISLNPTHHNMKLH